MSKHDAHNPSQLRDRQWRLKGHLLLAFWLTCPWVAWAQERSGLDPGVKVVATLEGYASAWSPNGQRLAYVTRDGIWVVEAPEFRQPRRLLRKGHCAGGSCPAQQLLWSPDGQKLAFTDSRPGDGGSTIWLTDMDGLRVQDLLPPQLSDSFGSGRAVWIDTWLSPRELAFAQHVGTGAVALHKIDVESRRYWSVCVADVERGWHWAPTKDRLVIAGRMGALTLVDGRHVVPSASNPSPDCRAVIPPLQCGVMENDVMQGGWYAFDDWAPDGKRALLTRYDCQAISPGSSRESGGDLYLWEVGSKLPEKLVPNATSGAWSPDGSQMAFLLLGKPRLNTAQQLVGADFEPGHPYILYVGIMQFATRAVHTLGPLGPEPVALETMFWSRDKHPLWSPTGKQVAVRDLRGDIFLLQADGTGRWPLAQRGHTKVYCDATCIQWSPDGKRLALWPRGRYLAGEGYGLERFLPPVGKEDAALSDAEVIERYFQKTLALGPEVLPNYPFVLVEYAQALEQMGKVEVSEARYLEAIELVRHSPQWTGADPYPVNSYINFLCRHGWGKEAAEFFASAPLIWRSCPGRPNAGMHPVQQPLPPLYIVEVPEKGK